uniref:hypothetical protein n=1 Tax=Nocardia amikacinitolerans TaxID=756689 RepID=UPI0020D27CDF
MIVDGWRPNRRAIDRIDSSAATPTVISSRSESVNRDRGPQVFGSPSAGFTPPASRNHRIPLVADAPTANPAADADTPLPTTKSQNERVTA